MKGSGPPGEDKKTNSSASALPESKIVKSVLLEKVILNYISRASLIQFQLILMTKTRLLPLDRCLIFLKSLQYE